MQTWVGFCLFSVLFIYVRVFVCVHARVLSATGPKKPHHFGKFGQSRMHSFLQAIPTRVISDIYSDIIICFDSWKNARNLMVIIVGGN